MHYTLSQQLYKYEHGLTSADQRATDIRIGEAAAELRDLRLRLRHGFRIRRPAFRLAHRGQHAGPTLNASW